MLTIIQQKHNLIGMVQVYQLPTSAVGLPHNLLGYRVSETVNSLGPINIKVDAQKHNPFCKAASQNSTIVKAVHPQLSALPNGEHWKYTFDGPFPI